MACALINPCDHEMFECEKRDNIVTMVATAWELDKRCGYARADLIEHGYLKSLFDKFAAGVDAYLFRTTKGMRSQCAGTTALVRAARVLDDDRLLSLALLWNPGYIPVCITDPQRMTIEHVNVDDVVTYLNSVGAPTCAATWVRMHRVRPLTNPPVVDFRCTAVKSSLPSSLVPSDARSVPEWVTRPVERRSILLQYESLTRPDPWMGNLRNTLLVCEFDDAADGCIRKEHVFALAAKAKEMFDLSLVEVYSSRYAFHDSGLDQNLFRLHMCIIATELDLKLRFAIRVPDPGQSLVLWGRPDPVSLEEVGKSPWVVV